MSVVNYLSTKRSAGKSNHYFLLNIIIALGCCALDYASKKWVMTHYLWGISHPITWYLNFELTANQGVAFSWFSHSGSIALYLSLAVAFIVTVWLIDNWLMARDSVSRPSLYNISSAVLLGGVWGNAIDRLCYGVVIDFIEFHWAYHWYFPIFNVADICITIGSLTLFYASNINSKNKR